MKERIDLILSDLGKEINLPLSLDDTGSCSLIVDDKLIIQIEPSQSQILIGSFVCQIPPGKYRENVFTNTLKANYLIPRVGTFAFNEMNAQLVLFEYLPVNISTLELKNFLVSFIEKAFIWKDSVENGNSAPTEFLREIEKIKK